MKRLLSAFLCDIRYQWRYGFYLLYALLIASFIALVRLLPAAWRPLVLAVTLLSDPALIGFLFIGALLQFERGEGILEALFMSPLRPWEYLAAKALSLTALTVLAAGLIALGSGVPGVNYGLLLPAMALAGVCFTCLSVAVAVNLRTMNAFLGTVALWEPVLLMPPLLSLLGVGFAPLAALPGNALLALITASAGGGGAIWGPLIVLASWTAVLAWAAHIRLRGALSRLGGGAA